MIRLDVKDVYVYDYISNPESTQITKTETIPGTKEKYMYKIR